jgi:hypothetical protein
MNIEQLKNFFTGKPPQQENPKTPEFVLPSTGILALSLKKAHYPGDIIQFRYDLEKKKRSKIPMIGRIEQEAKEITEQRLETNRELIPEEFRDKIPDVSWILSLFCIQEERLGIPDLMAATHSINSDPIIQTAKRLLTYKLIDREIPDDPDNDEILYLNQKAEMLLREYPKPIK